MARPGPTVARKLRRNATDVERRLWYALGSSGLPYKFRRQHPIGTRIADFACPLRKLVIELDGGQHADNIAADRQRDAELAAYGYRVIRFWNNDVLENLDGVMETIRQALTVPPPHPNPLRPRRAERGLLVAAALASLFASAAPAAARPLEQVKESGAIVLCAHPNALPFSAKDGARHGFQLELGAAIAREMGVGFETHWTVSAHDLNRADCDFVLDAIADPEAQEESRLTLSKPYGSSGVALAVRADNDSIHAFADLAGAGKIGILPGSMAAMYLGQHGVHTSPAGFESDLLDEVASGDVAGAAVTPTAVGYYNAGHAAHPMKALTVFASVRDLNWNLAAGIAKPDPALSLAIDAALDKLIAAGTITAIYARYGVALSPPR